MAKHEVILTDDEEILIGEIAKQQGVALVDFIQGEFDSRMNDVIERNIDATIGAGNMPYIRTARIKAAAELIAAKVETP